MSFKNVQSCSTAPKDLVASTTPWKRNPAWPALTTPSGSTEQLIGLYAVFPNGSNFAAVRFYTTTGNYQVDWGDGTVDSTASASATYHTYDYANVALDGTNAPVTLTASTGKVNRTSHGYKNGDVVRLYNIVTTTGITSSQPYYVINAATNDFQISLTPNGSAVVMTNDGSATLLPYKIATVTITPVTGGAKFTQVDLTTLHNQAGLITQYTTGWLDIRANLTYASGLAAFTIGNGGASTARSRLVEYAVISTTDFGASPTFNLMSNLRAVDLTITSSSIVGLPSFFNGCANLTDVQMKFPNGATINTTASMFSGCASLRTAPLLPLATSGTVDVSSMFLGCGALESVPLYNTQQATNMSNMFSGCTALQSVPLFNTASVTSMSNMFQYCSNLLTVPLFNTASVINMSAMFQGTTTANMRLQSVPLFNTASVTNMSSMFGYCGALKSVPTFNTASVTNMSNMFFSCKSLVTAPPFNTVACQNFTSMFDSCTSLEYVPLYDTTALTGTSGVSGMFNQCLSLRELPAMDIGKAISSSAAYSNTFLAKLSYIGCVGAKFTHTIASNMLSGTALDAYYTGLPTVTGQTLTVTSNWGTTSDNPSIATAKGWTVTGS